MTLPPLTDDEAAHSEQVAAHIRALIAGEGGWLPFPQFMDAALYAPGLGYYMAGRVRFGAGGDFITAPEISPLFARCLATQVAEMLELTSGGDLVEFGAGSGALAAGLLEALAAAGVMPRRYRIVEISAPLRALQRERIAKLPGLGERVEWMDEPPASSWQGVAIANEVLDAMPVDRFRAGRGSCEAIGVVVAGNGFAWQARPAGAALAEAVRHVSDSLSEPLPDRLRIGIAADAARLDPAATAPLKKGALLICDYGLPRSQYYHPSRDGGSLCAFYRHRRVEDVFARIGMQDLTAWVDFTSVAEAADAAGLELAGFATQAHFLASLGIERELAAAVDGAGTREALELKQAAATLLLPGEMGERFKVMALARRIGVTFAGFGFRDLSASL